MINKLIYYLLFSFFEHGPVCRLVSRTVTTWVDSLTASDCDKQYLRKIYNIMFLSQVMGFFELLIKIGKMR